MIHIDDFIQNLFFLASDEDPEVINQSNKQKCVGLLLTTVALH